MTPSIGEIYNQQIATAEHERRDFFGQALAKWQKTLQDDPRSSKAYTEIARCHWKLRQYKESIAILEQGLRRKDCVDSYRLYQWHIVQLDECNRTREAIASAQRAIEAYPNDIWLKLKEALLLPVLYDSTKEIEEYRARFAEGLHRLCKEIFLDTPETRKNALSAIAAHVNLRLGYQACNDRELQVEYGQLVHRIVAANYPDWVKPLSMPDFEAGGKIRVGYVSSRFRNLSATKYFLGWMRGHSKEAISVHAYHTAPKVDSITEQVRQASDVYRDVADSLETARQAIAADRLHVLVFLDVGLEPIMTQLAALRLAPVQCAAWDQPVTTGLPTIDYFLSSALTEPKGAQGHYAEELVPLPGVGVCYEKPVIPAVLLDKTRGDFGLREDAVVYLCIQYAYKYLPDQDAVLVKIAEQVRNAQFVFLTENEFIAADLDKRLRAAFSAANLWSEERCVILHALERLTYWNLSLLGDVFLDPIGWSGGVSTFDAIACGLPIVTWPGEFMRGRQSYAILTQLGVADTTARDASEYVRLAVRLGLDRKWRADIVGRMAAQRAALYSDRSCVPALEQFFERAVQERLREGGTDVTGVGHI